MCVCHECQLYPVSLWFAPADSRHPCSDVFKALNKTRGLYLRWRELGEAAAAAAESEWTTTELRNSLRSIEWDLEDLEDTINILFTGIL